jgi:GNAT superfamily N-acetyltransferase
MIDSYPLPSQSEVAFRPAQPQDSADLLSMMQQLQADDPWSVPFNQPATAKALVQLLEDASLGRVWIIVADGQNIGYIVMAFDYSLEYCGRGAWVDEVFVRRSYRGRGIGAQTLDFFCQQAAQLGVTAVHLEVNHGNPAIELYRRHGFEDHQRYLMTKWIIPKP